MHYEAHPIFLPIFWNLLPLLFDIYSQELRARKAGQVVQNIPPSNYHTLTTQATAILDLKIQDVPLWVNTDADSFRTTLPFSTDFHTRPFNAALRCLWQWNACSSGNRSWQSMKEVQRGTETTRELLLLTPVRLPWPGRAALRKEKGAQALGSAVPGPSMQLTNNGTKQCQLRQWFLWCESETASN